jgi:hypothetical protein
MRTLLGKKLKSVIIHVKNFGNIRTSDIKVSNRSGCREIETWEYRPFGFTFQEILETVTEDFERQFLEQSFILKRM